MKNQHIRDIPDRSSAAIHAVSFLTTTTDPVVAAAVAKALDSAAKSYTLPPLWAAFADEHRS